MITDITPEFGKNETDGDGGWKCSVAPVEPLLIDTIKRRYDSGIYVNNPLIWAKEVIGYIPDQQQSIVVKNYLNNQFNAIKSGHGTGKSCTLSVMSLHFLTTRHFSIVPSTAPSQHQLHDILWKEHAKWIDRSEYLRRLLDWNKTTIKVRKYGEQWHAIARTSRAKGGDDTNVGLQGFHAGPHSGGIMYAIDEASGVPESSMGAVEGALSEPLAYVVMGGNPTHLSGTFYHAFHKDADLWPGRHTLSCLNSSVVSKSYAERIARKYGKDSDTYRVKVLGQFPLSESEGLIPITFVELAFALSPDEVIQENIVEAGLDVALQGSNKTVLYIRRGNAVFHKAYCNEVKEEDIAGWLATKMREFDVDVISIDCIGVGSGVASHMRKMPEFRHKVRVYKSSNKAVGHKSKLGYDPEEQFFNIRAQAFYYLRTLFVAGMISLCYELDGNQDEPLMEQLISIKVHRQSGKVQIESKEQMQSRQMPSPDEADALSICFSSDLDKLAKIVIGSGIVKAHQERNNNIFGALGSGLGRNSEFGGSGTSVTRSSFWNSLRVN